MSFFSPYECQPLDPIIETLVLTNTTTSKPSGDSTIDTLNNEASIINNTVHYKPIAHPMAHKVWHHIPQHHVEECVLWLAQWFKR